MKGEQRKLKKALQARSDELQLMLEERAAGASWNKQKYFLLTGRISQLQHDLAQLNKPKNVIPDFPTRRLTAQLLEVERKYLETQSTPCRLHCPRCGSKDVGNRFNGKPWCFKCHVPLQGNGEKTKPIRILSKHDIIHHSLKTLLEEKKDEFR